MNFYSLVLFQLFITAFVFADKPEYDAIAGAYQKSKQLDIRAAVDTFSIFFYAGDLRGKTVLDLACGEGFYARKFADAGAKQVTGVDISSQMIALATKEEEKAPKGVRYIVHDASQPIKDLGTFDVVTGIFLLHYASSVKELCAFTDQIYADLNPGGIFVALNAEPKSINFDPDYYKAYGFAQTHQKPVRDSSLINVKLFNKDGTTAAFHGYHYDRATYTKCLQASGFKNIEFLPVLISPNSIADKGWDYWLNFIKKPSSMIIRAGK